jgi:2-hydroxychromene-2-carboxylate isomerase
MSDTIDFWFSTGSTYTYLTVSRLQKVEAETGVRFNWRPFSVRALMREQNNIPFATKPIKTAYMWRDIERRAGGYGIPLRVPVPYPLQAMDLANAVAVLGRREGWCADYARATYRRWFQHGQEPGLEPNLSDSLREIGHDPGRVVAAAQAEEVAAALRAATAEAKALGVFGSPSFVTRDGELFWGDDRLEDAVAWHRSGTLAGRLRG